MKKLLALAMVSYVGTLSVHAAPMMRQEYNDFRGWQLPENENGDDSGYLIEDREGKKNTDQLDGFVQWLPKDEFERKFSNKEVDLVCSNYKPSEEEKARYHISVLNELAANPLLSCLLS